jgi:hypothetical protein
MPTTDVPTPMPKAACSAAIDSSWPHCGSGVAQLSGSPSVTRMMCCGSSPVSAASLLMVSRSATPVGVSALNVGFGLSSSMTLRIAS